MDRKTVPLTGIKTAGLDEGMFEGWASTFGNIDHANDRVMPGAFAKSIQSGRVIPLNWEHRGSVDPRCMVGQIVKAEEVAEGLHIVGAFDVDSEFGAAAYRAVKSRRVGALSIGYVVNRQSKAVDGVNELVDVDLVEVSVVSRPANDRALVTSVKSVGADVTESIRTRVARARVAAKAGEIMHDKSNAEERYMRGRDEQLVLAKTIVDAANELERDLTGDEADQVEKHLAEADRLEKTVAASRRSQTIMSQLDAMAPREQTFRDGEPVTKSSAAVTDNRRLTFKGMAANVATKMLGEHGEKALAPSGAAVVSQEFADDPIPLGRIATGLLDVLPVKVHSTPEVAYMRQTTPRMNNAAIVAEGAVKPTSPIGVTRVEASLAVIAHLSEGIPRYWLLDNESLQQFIDTELRYGLGVAVEAKVVADINGTSGIQSQTFSTSVLATLRKSITRLEANGYPAGSIVLHPNDWEGVELALASTNAVEHLSLPYDPASRRLFGVPVVTTVSATAGVGHVLAQGAVALDTDSNGVGVQWSENSNADDFSKNLIRARCEGRFATSIYSPLGVVVADLTA